MTRISRKAPRRERRPLSFTSSAAGPFIFSFAEPALPPATWPEGKAWPRRAVLLDLDPWFIESKGDTPDLPAKRIAEQGWPHDTLINARRIGLHIELDDSGIPWVGCDVVEDRPNVFLHDLVLGFVTPGGREPTAAEWEALRRELHGRRVRTLEHLPKDCLALHYFTEGDMSFLLTSSKEMVEEWIASLLFAEFPELLDAIKKLGMIRTPLSEWILNRGADVGLRLEKVQLKSGPHGPTMRLRGKWGIDPDSLAVGLGSSTRSGEPFDCEVGLK